MTDVLEECREKLTRGASVEEVLQTLRVGGFSKVRSMKALVDLQQANVDEAKRIVHYSQTWADRRESDEEFHRSLDELLERRPPGREHG